LALRTQLQRRHDAARPSEDPLKIKPSIGAEAKITGVARRITPVGQRSGEGGNDSDDDDLPACVRRPEASLEKKPVVKSATLAIADEHTHFASMLNRRMERYSAEPQAESREHPAHRFASNSSSQVAGGPDYYASTGSHDAKQAVSNELKVLEHQGRGQPATATGQSAIPSFSSPDAWLRRRGEERAPQGSNACQEAGSTEKWCGSKRGSTSSGNSIDTHIPSHTTHIHRRQPGREGMGVTPRGRWSGRVAVPTLNLRTAVSPTPGAPPHCSPHGSGPRAESCLQALAAIDLSARPRY